MSCRSSNRIIDGKFVKNWHEATGQKSSNHANQKRFPDFEKKAATLLKNENYVLFHPVIKLNSALPVTETKAPKIPLIWLMISTPFELFKLNPNPTIPPPILPIIVETAALAAYFHLPFVKP